MRALYYNYSSLTTLNLQCHPPLMNIFKKHQLYTLISPYLPTHPVIIEAGAFDGSDTQKTAAFWPQATIHAFEPVPEIFELLTQSTASLENIHRYQIALSNTNGHATFHVSQKPSRPGKPFQAGSLHEPHERLAWSDAQYTHTITVPTIRLDDWAHEHAIDHIDFLWLDAQGHELAILRGAPEMLNTVKVIYVEVHFIQAYHGQPLAHELISWIEAQGFELIAQDYENETDWFFGNVIFVRNT